MVWLLNMGYEEKIERGNQYRILAMAKGPCFALGKAIFEITNFRLHHKGQDKLSRI